MVIKKLSDGLKKTRNQISSKLKSIFVKNAVINDEFIEDIEDILIQTDMGFDTVTSLVEKVESSLSNNDKKDISVIYDSIKTELKTIITPHTEQSQIKKTDNALNVILIVGVNGTGKTTSLAKIANRYLSQNKKVILAACDTFRGAAIEQLEVWAQRTGTYLVKHQHGADAAAVAFDAVEAALARNADYLIIDTAGRLHTNKNLMEELKKIKRTVQKRITDAPHEVLMTIDAVTGQNALPQVKTFHDALSLTGLILTKLDGTAKGGVVIRIQNEFKIPVKYIGVGEQIDDLLPFNANDFIDALFEE